MTFAFHAWWINSMMFRIRCNIAEHKHAEYVHISCNTYNNKSYFFSCPALLFLITCIPIGTVCIISWLSYNVNRSRLYSAIAIELTYYFDMFYSICHLSSEKSRLSAAFSAYWRYKTGKKQNASKGHFLCLRSWIHIITDYTFRAYYCREFSIIPSFL